MKTGKLPDHITTKLSQKGNHNYENRQSARPLRLFLMLQDQEGITIEDAGALAQLTSAVGVNELSGDG